MTNRIRSKEDCLLFVPKPKTKEQAMKETITFQVTKSVGYSGKGSAKTWIARITGTDDDYIFQREFVETEATDREEMFRVRRKHKGSWTEAAACEPGLYEINAGADDRRYRVVYRPADADAKFVKIDVDRATKMAMLMDGGATCEEARQQTKPPAKEVEVQA